MSTVAEIKSAIDHFSFEGRCELEALLHPRVDDDWDRQMAADAGPGGKLDRLFEQAEAEHRAGALREFPQPYKA